MGWDRNDTEIDLAAINEDDRVVRLSGGVSPRGSAIGSARNRWVPVAASCRVRLAPQIRVCVRHSLKCSTCLGGHRAPNHAGLAYARHGGAVRTGPRRSRRVPGEARGRAATGRGASWRRSTRPPSRRFHPWALARTCAFVRRESPAPRWRWTSGWCIYWRARADRRFEGDAVIAGFRAAAGW